MVPHYNVAPFLLSQKRFEEHKMALVEASVADRVYEELELM